MRPTLLSYILIPRINMPRVNHPFTPSEELEACQNLHIRVRLATGQERVSIQCEHGLEIKRFFLEEKTIACMVACYSWLELKLPALRPVADIIVAIALYRVRVWLHHSAIWCCNRIHLRCNVPRTRSGLVRIKRRFVTHSPKFCDKGVRAI